MREFTRCRKYLMQEEKVPSPLFDNTKTEALEVTV